MTTHILIKFKKKRFNKLSKNKQTFDGVRDELHSCRWHERPPRMRASYPACHPTGSFVELHDHLAKQKDDSQPTRAPEKKICISGDCIWWLRQVETEGSEWISQHRLVHQYAVHFKIIRSFTSLPFSQPIQKYLYSFIFLAPSPFQPVCWRQQKSRCLLTATSTTFPSLPLIVPTFAQSNHTSHRTFYISVFCGRNHLTNLIVDHLKNLLTTGQYY